MTTTPSVQAQLAQPPDSGETPTGSPAEMESSGRLNPAHMTISHILLSCIFEAFHYGDMYDMPYAEWCKIQDCLAPVGLYLDEAEGATDRGPSSYYNPHNPV